MTLLALCLSGLLPSFGQCGDDVNKVQPSVMVLPRTVAGEDLRTIIDDQPEIRLAMSRVKQYLDENENYPGLDFETRLKAIIRDGLVTNEMTDTDAKLAIFKNIPADIIIEIDPVVVESSSGNLARIILEANVTDNGQSMGSMDCESNRYYTDDAGALYSSSLRSKTPNNLECLDEFLKNMSNNWADLVNNGKHLKIEFGLAEDSKWDMDAEVPSKKDRLKYVIEDWLGDTAFKNNYVVLISTEKRMVIDDYRFPICDPETGRNKTSRNVERDLDRFFSKMEVPAKFVNNRGSLYVTIQ